jgi:hypothetical protein
MINDQTSVENSGRPAIAGQRGTHRGSQPALYITAM